MALIDNLSPLLSNEQLTGHEGYLPLRSLVVDRLALQRADYSSLMDVSPGPVRIARQWKWGLRMAASTRGHGWPETNLVRLSPPQPVQPTRGYRGVSLRGELTANTASAAWIPAVYVPAG